jgi:hypothetical protein
MLHAGVLTAAYWAEGSTNSSGIYTLGNPLATQSGASVRGSIPTDANQAQPDYDVVNYFTTGNYLAGAQAAYNNTLLGDLSWGEGLFAVFSLNDSNLASGEQFQAGNIVGEVGGYLPNIRLMFRGANLGQNRNQWWSNPIAAYVTSMYNGTDVELYVPFDPSQWSNFNGQLGNSSAQATSEFEQALSGVTQLGLSFGSGWGFADGFAFNDGGDGTAYVQLDSIVTTPEPSCMFPLTALALIAAFVVRRKHASASR